MVKTVMMMMMMTTMTVMLMEMTVLRLAMAMTVMMVMALIVFTMMLIMTVRMIDHQENDPECCSFDDSKRTVRQFIGILLFQPPVVLPDRSEPDSAFRLTRGWQPSPFSLPGAQCD